MMVIGFFWVEGDREEWVYCKYIFEVDLIGFFNGVYGNNKEK